MRVFALTILLIFLEIAMAFGILYLPPKADMLCLLFGCILPVIYIWKIKKKSNLKALIKIANFNWTINDFCRGVLITGQTGSGKTACAIRHILHALFHDVPNWGGVVVDTKGQFYEIVKGTAEYYKAGDKIIVLRVDGNQSIQYNPLSYPGIPWKSYAEIIIDTAESTGTELKNYWKSTATDFIESILILIAIEKTPDFGDLYDYVNNQNECQKLAFKNLKNLDFTIKNAAITLKTFLTMSAATRDSIISSTKNTLTFFSDPEIRKVFCPSKNTIDFKDIDNGKIFILSMSQKHRSARLFFNTFLKLLFYSHALLRFDKPSELPQKNMIIYLADEAQQIVTSSHGSSDHEAVGILREAKATYILATQSITSLKTKLKKEAVDTLVLNLATHFYFTCADQESADAASKTLGFHLADDISHSVSKQGDSTNIKEIEKPLLAPYELRQLKKYQCVIKHPDGTVRKMYLPPLNDKNQTPLYYYRDRFGSLLGTFLYFFQL